jgi:putative phosphoribosyl transferase
MTEPEGVIEIPVPGAALRGDLLIPDRANGLVIFAHGSGSSRLSPRNRHVASQLREQGLGTFLFDLLTDDEERIDAVTREYRFDIPFLAHRLVHATSWLTEHRPSLAPAGYFGASTGAAAALVAAAALPETIRAVVSRGGRPDLAADALTDVRAATLMIVGGNDREVLRLNESALGQLRCEKALVVVPFATHLFEEPGALEAVAAHAAEWFTRHFASMV